MSSYTIGITCTTVFHYVHFKRIEHQLKGKGYKVIYIIYTPYFTKERVNRLIEVFQANNVQYCGFEDLFLGNIKFDILLSPYYMPSYQLVDKNIKKVRLLYGYAKDRWNYAEWNEGFDLILSYGDYATERLEKYAPTVNIGHPRQRNTYKSELKDIQGARVNRQILATKESIVYCPTWSDLSSLQQFIDSIEELTKDFNVIVKLHHGNVLSLDKSIWESLYHLENVYLFDEFTDLFDLLQFADAVISDYSGAIFDAMLFKIPIVLLDILDDSIVDTGKVNLNTMQDISKYSGNGEIVSLDIKIRDIMPHVRDFKELPSLLKKAITLKQIPYLGLLDELYSMQDNEAPTRAVSAIENVLYSDKQSEDIDKIFHLIDENRLNAFLNRHKNHPFNIWGAGLSGQILFAYLKNKNMSLGALMDRDPDKFGKEFLGTKIEAPKLEGKILIAVPGNANESIKNTLIENGLKEDLDFISIFRN
ncbi:CDP-glycerol glycerophosphotransferase family protein [Lysinibacillus xylanilyticus]|uniref:CDP-glycerol glycerophosphotransferase family protein n=1 Tax=Lysinibacillus xylanilyticus TaxID=582475 RepID=UPI0038237DF7